MSISVLFFVFCFCLIYLLRAPGTARMNGQALLTSGDPSWCAYVRICENERGVQTSLNLQLRRRVLFSANQLIQIWLVFQIVLNTPFFQQIKSDLHRVCCPVLSMGVAHSSVTLKHSDGQLGFTYLKRFFQMNTYYQLPKQVRIGNLFTMLITSASVFR